MKDDPRFQNFIKHDFVYCSQQPFKLIADEVLEIQLKHFCIILNLFEIYTVFLAWLLFKKKKKNRSQKATKNQLHSLANINHCVWSKYIFG